MSLSLEVAGSFILQFPDFSVILQFDFWNILIRNI